MVLLAFFVFRRIHGVPHGEGASATRSDGFHAVEIVDSVVKRHQTARFSLQLGFDAFVRIGKQKITAGKTFVKVQDGTVPKDRDGSKKR